MTTPDTPHERPAEAPTWAAPRATPVAREGSRRGRTVIVAIAAFVTGALVASAVWFVLGDGDDDPDEIDATPIELPDEVAGLRLQVDVMADVDADNDSYERMVAKLDHLEARASEQLSAAYGGAGAGGAAYASDDLDVMVTILAVRAESPRLVSTDDFPDPADIGLEINRVTVEHFGEVDCTVHHGTVAAGDEPDPEAELLTGCQRTGPGLTVFLVSGNSASPEVGAAAVDAAWRALAADDVDG